MKEQFCTSIAYHAGVMKRSQVENSPAAVAGNPSGVALKGEFAPFPNPRLSLRPLFVGATSLIPGVM